MASRFKRGLSEQIASAITVSVWRVFRKPNCSVQGISRGPDTSFAVVVVANAAATCPLLDGGQTRSLARSAKRLHVLELQYGPNHVADPIDTTFAGTEEVLPASMFAGAACPTIARPKSPRNAHVQRL